MLARNNGRSETSSPVVVRLQETTGEVRQVRPLLFSHFRSADSSQNSPNASHYKAMFRQPGNRTGSNSDSGTARPAGVAYCVLNRVAPAALHDMYQRLV